MAEAFVAWGALRSAAVNSRTRHLAAMLLHCDPSTNTTRGATGLRNRRGWPRCGQPQAAGARYEGLSNCPEACGRKCRLADNRLSRGVPMSHANLYRCFIALSLLLPIPALAQSAFTTQAVNVRAGPDRAFPLVTWLRPGTPVNVIGCINGWRWCDVVAGGWRGWVYSRYLSGPIRSRAPVITFSVGSYWGAHYRGRPWYSNQSSWNNWGSPGFRPPPRPRPPVARPPSGEPPSRGRPPRTPQ